jgi:hypothetical protein
VFETDTSRPSGQLVRAELATASRRRRLHLTSRQFWQAAPIVAASGLIFGVIRLLAGWSWAVPLVVLGFGFGGLIAYTVVRRRDRGLSDTVAAGIDRDAALGGELRSAAWFATHETPDAWTAFHLDRAADRLHTVNWVEQYPPARAGRAKLATAAMVIATLSLSVAMTSRRPVSTAVAPETTPPKTPAAASIAVNGETLPPELLKLLAELLAAAESGNAPIDGKLASSAELRELLAHLAELRDAGALKELARAMNADPILLSDRAKEMALADRTKKAAEMEALSPEIREALEKMSNNLSIAANEEAADDDSDAAAVASAGEKAKPNEGTGAESPSIQSAKDADAGEGAGVMMVSSADARPGNTPGAGVGGGSSGQNGTGTMPDIERALRSETVEASTDNSGQNVLTEVRRKTEYGQATTSFTQGAAGAFDRSRAVAPPPVPEGRRSAVQTYFIRKP